MSKNCSGENDDDRAPLKLEPKIEARGLAAATKRLADYCKHAICAVRCTARRLLLR